MEHTIYLVCAIAGCTLVGLQVVLQLFGLFGDMDVDGGHADMDAGHDLGMDAGHDLGMDADGDHGHFDNPDSPDGHGNLFFGILSLKAICAFVGVFGLVGLILLPTGVSVIGRIAISSGSGFVAMLGVGRLMFMLSQLYSEGNVNIRNAVGLSGVVYLRIPERGEGRGKVTLEIQGRSMEFTAISEGEAIKSGAPVKVVSVEAGELLKVVPV